MANESVRQSLIPTLASSTTPRDDGTYQYSKLLQEDSIRLIYLQPSTDLEAEVQCELRETTLSECLTDIVNHYVAISYVWGDQNDRRTITVHGKRLDITASLDSALRHVRDSHRLLLVWADGVSINQNDVMDRNRQVGLMGEIYSAAHHTVIFLGRPSSRFDSLLDDLISSSTKSSSRRGSVRAVVRHIEDHQEGTIKHFGSTLEDDFLARPWFTRVWILQELLLSKDPWVQCGRSRVRWNILCKQLERRGGRPISRDPSRILVLRDMNDILLRLKDERADYPPGSFLLEILCTRRGYGHSDPRDLVFAHLGLTSSATRNKVMVDYEKTTFDVYVDIARLFLNISSLPFVLSLVEKAPLEKRRHCLPSWVPDWSSSYEDGVPNGLYDPKRRQKQTNGEIFVMTDLHTIAIWGGSLGAITDLIPQSIWPVSYPREKIVRSFSEWLTTPNPAVVNIRQALVSFSVGIALGCILHENSNQTVWDTVVDAKLCAALSTVATELTSASEAEWLIRISRQEAHQVETVKRFKINKSVEILVYLLLEFSQCHRNHETVAIMEDGRLVSVPEWSRAGDSILYSQDAFQSPIYHFVARPCSETIDLKEQQIARQALATQNECAVEQLLSASESHCKFVGLIDIPTLTNYITATEKHLAPEKRTRFTCTRSQLFFLH